MGTGRGTAASSEEQTDSETRLILVGRDTATAAHAISPPLVRTSATMFSSFAEYKPAQHGVVFGAPRYGRSGTSTTFELQRAMAETSGTETAIATSSGLAAMAVFHAGSLPRVRPSCDRGSCACRCNSDGFRWQALKSWRCGIRTVESQRTGVFMPHGDEGHGTRKARVSTIALPATPGDLVVIAYDDWDVPGTSPEWQLSTG